MNRWLAPFRRGKSLLFPPRREVNHLPKLKNNFKNNILQKTNRITALHPQSSNRFPLGRPFSAGNLFSLTQISHSLRLFSEVSPFSVQLGKSRTSRLFRNQNTQTLSTRLLRGDWLECVIPHFPRNSKMTAPHLAYAYSAQTEKKSSHSSWGMENSISSKFIKSLGGLLLLLDGVWLFLFSSF